VQTQDLQRFLSVEGTLTKTLVSWSVASIALGTSIALTGRKFEKKDLTEFGRQTAAWGGVDLVIAGAGYLAQRRRGALSEEQTQRQIRNLRRLLVINAVADVGYVAGGMAILKRSIQKKSAFRMGSGDGYAIVIQGAFLFVLDVSQAKRLRNISELSV
jgi:hypothetical protein